MSPLLARYCCKSQKLVGDDFPAAGRFNRRPPICVASIGLPRSLASLSSGDEVPHIFTGELPLRPGEFWIIRAKGLLQQNLPKAAVSRCSKKRFNHHVVEREQHRRQHSETIAMSHPSISSAPR